MYHPAQIACRDRRSLASDLSIPHSVLSLPAVTREQDNMIP